jgi:hypothetical protein
MNIDLLRTMRPSGSACKSPAPPLLAKWMLQDEEPPTLTFWAWNASSGGLAFLRDGSPIQSFGWPVLRTYFQHPLVAAFWGSKLLTVSPASRTGPILLLHDRATSQIQAWVPQFNHGQYETNCGSEVKALLAFALNSKPSSLSSLFGQARYWDRADKCRQWLDSTAFELSCSQDKIGEVLGQDTIESVF